MLFSDFFSNPYVAEELCQQAMATFGLGEQHPDRLGVNRLLLRPVPLALQRRVMRQFLQQTLSISPNFHQIEKLTSLINAPNHCRTDPFLRSIVAEVEGDWIWLSLEPKK
jgi:tRNA(Ile)-lysidine synthase